MGVGYKDAYPSSNRTGNIAARIMRGGAGISLRSTLAIGWPGRYGRLVELRPVQLDMAPRIRAHRREQRLQFRLTNRIYSYILILPVALAEVPAIRDHLARWRRAPMTIAQAVRDEAARNTTMDILTAIT